MDRMNRGTLTALLGVGLLGPLSLSGCANTSDAQSCPLVAPDSSTCGITGGGCAPESARIDLCEPTFSNPTTVTNPLFPISNLHSVVSLGDSEGAPLRVEVTLLPHTKDITWKGRAIPTLESQFVAFQDG